MIMKDGYIRIAAASFDTNIADIKNNSLQICKLIEQAYENKAKIIVFPELCLTGYTCEDLFNQDRLLNKAKFQLQNIIEKTINKDIIVVVGLPYQHLELSLQIHHIHQLYTTFIYWVVIIVCKEI